MAYNDKDGLTQKDWKNIQDRINRYRDSRKLSYRHLSTDGNPGDATRGAIKETKWFLGFSPEHAENANATALFITLLWKPERQKPRGKAAAKARQIKRRRNVRRTRETRIRRVRRQWQGSRWVAEAHSIKIAKRRGIAVTSRKRAWWHRLSRRNPSSDHNTANKNAYALDFGTFDGAGLAHEIAKSYGWHDYRTGNFNRFSYRAKDGGLYSVQILWNVAGTHRDHCHLGVKRIG